MLPKGHRIKEDKDFKRLAVRGRSFYSPFISVRLMLNGLKETRFAFIISAKVSKKAVLRNKLRRRLREIIRLHLARIKQGFDGLVVARAKALDLGYHELEEELIVLLKKARIYNE